MPLDHGCCCCWLLLLLLLLLHAQRSYPSGHGAGLEIQWALPAQVRILPIASFAKRRGGVAQMVERSLSMREVQGSIPCISRFCDVGTQSLPSSVGRAQGP